MAQGAVGSGRYRCQALIRVGNPATEIMREAAAGPYDLLVVGQRPEYGVLTRLTGTTVARILRSAPCPVLVAKGKL
ncbi:MAG: universal stress protein [Chloroflexota bacterium]